MTTPAQALAHLLHAAHRTPVPEEEITITCQDPALPTNFLLGTVDAAVIAAAAGLRSDRYCRVNGTHAPAWPA